MKTSRIVQMAAIAVTIGVLQAASFAFAETAASDSIIQTELTKSLRNAKFKDVQATVQNGVISLTGAVSLYGVKADADKKAHKIKTVAGVRNDIVVNGPAIPDDLLQRKLLSQIQSDRIGYGTTTFNAISLSVQNGIVTLGGSAYGPVDKSDALADASYTPGVKGIVDNIQVDPLSTFDDRIRLSTARAIYGFPSLNKYAINPVKPIRIAVQNGAVTLVGTVWNEADKDVAGIRANGVPGVFKVTNNLQVANQQLSKN